MEICRASSSAAAAAAAAAFLAADFVSLSTLPRVSTARRSTSATHLAFVHPGGLSFGARGFLVFGKPSRPILGGMVEEREEEELQLWGISTGRMEICGAIWRENEIWVQ